MGLGRKPQRALWRRSLIRGKNQSRLGGCSGSSGGSPDNDARGETRRVALRCVASRCAAPWQWRWSWLCCRRVVCGWLDWIGRDKDDAVPNVSGWLGNKRRGARHLAKLDGATSCCCGRSDGGRWPPTHHGWCVHAFVRQRQSFGNSGEPSFSGPSRLRALWPRISV